MGRTGFPWEVASTVSCARWPLMGPIFSPAARSRWQVESTRSISRSGTEPTGRCWAAGSQGPLWTRSPQVAAVSMPEGDLPVQEELLQLILRGGMAQIGRCWAQASEFTMESEEA